MPIDAAVGERLAACLPFLGGTARGPRLPFSFSGGRRRAADGPTGAILRLAVGGGWALGGSPARGTAARRGGFDERRN